MTSHFAPAPARATRLVAGAVLAVSLLPARAQTPPQLPCWGTSGLSSERSSSSVGQRATHGPAATSLALRQQRAHRPMWAAPARDVDRAQRLHLERWLEQVA